ILLRKQGELLEQFSFTSSWYPAFLKIVKQRCNLLQHPQGSVVEARVAFPFNHQPLYLRVSIVPTLFGDKIVFRVLSSHRTLLSLDELGMKRDLQTRFENVLDAGKGLIILCGSSGSGKTTTLY